MKDTQDQGCIDQRNQGKKKKGPPRSEEPKRKQGRARFRTGCCLGAKCDPEAKMLPLQSFLWKGVSWGHVGRNQNLKDLKEVLGGTRCLSVHKFCLVNTKIFICTRPQFFPFQLFREFLGAELLSLGSTMGNSDHGTTYTCTDICM